MPARIVVITPTREKSLRDLRNHHREQAERFKKLWDSRIDKRNRGFPVADNVQKYHHECNYHRRIVKALNEFFPPGDWA